MNAALSALKYVLIGLTVAMFVGLVAWYLFLHVKQGAITQTDAARGAGAPAPVSGSFGSTYQNIIAGLSGSFTAVSSAVQSTSTSTQPRLWHISITPAAGFGFMSVSASSSPKVRYVERSTGYVFDADADTRTIERVTNTLTPQVYDASVSVDGRIVERTLESGVITTIIGSTTQTDTGLGVLATTPLARNISSISFSPNGKEIFGIVSSALGTVGIRSLSDGSKPKQIFSSGIAGWHTQWLNDGRIILIQNSSDNISGYAYELTSSGSLLLLASGSGLSVLPQSDSVRVVYGLSTQSGLSLYVRLRPDAPPVALPVKTVADKCVWLQNGPTLFCAVPRVAVPSGFLDAWHRGEVHTSDQWWKIDVATGNAEALTLSDTPIDVQGPVIDAHSQYIIFRNAADQSLWGLRIAE